MSHKFGNPTKLSQLILPKKPLTKHISARKSSFYDLEKLTNQERVAWWVDRLSFPKRKG